jgi:type I restriction enzyme M protein
VPHGVLFRGSSEGKIRTKLIEENLLDCVIGLPEKLFFGTGIPAAILIFRKPHPTPALPLSGEGASSDSGLEKANSFPCQGGGREGVFFIDASRECKAGKNQNILTADNINKIVETYKARKNVDKYAYLANLEEIKENDYNLNIPRYVDTFEEEEEIDLMAVRKEREALKAQFAELEGEMDGYLKELGYE